MTLLAEHLRKAAHGQHRCGWCGNQISAGEQYRDQRIAEDGTVYTWREHPACATRIWSWWWAQQYDHDEMTDARATWAEMIADQEGTS